MEDLLYRNVHPLYSVMAFVCALIVLLLLISAARTRKSIQKNHRLMFLWVIFFCFQDAVWGLFAAHVIRSDAALFALSNIFHLSAIFSAPAWTVYFLSRLKGEIRHGRIYMTVTVVTTLMQVIMIIMNLNSRFMFYVDENGWYQTTSYRSVLFYLQFVTYILIGIVSFVGRARANKDAGSGRLAIFMVNLAPLFAGLLQLAYPDAPADSIGFSIGCVIIELFLSRDYEKQVISLEKMQQELQRNLDEITRQNTVIEQYANELKDHTDQLDSYKRAVLSDAIISLEVNLNRDELYYGVWKDSSGAKIPLKDIIGLEVPCSYDVYIDAWNKRFVKNENKTSFADSTNRSYLLETFAAGTSEITLDYEATTISGSSAWLRRSICMTQNQSGDVIAYTNVKDITTLVEKTKREETYVRALATDFESISVVTFETDKINDRVLFQSHIGQSITDLLDHDTIHEKHYSKKIHRMLRYVHTDDLDAFLASNRREAVLASFAAGRSHVVDFRLMKKDGSWVYYQFRFIPLRDEAGKPTGMIACTRNVDSEVRKELDTRRRLEEAMFAAKAANRAKSDFLFNMSHDIRTPMNAILGFTDMAEKYIDNRERVLDSLHKVKSAGSHLLMLINDVLDMSRVESGTVKIVEEPICIDGARDSLFNMLNGNAESKGIRLAAHIDDSVIHHWFFADRLCMNRVLTNVISNSIKYTNPGGKIDLILEELPCDREGCARFRYTVTDTGIGMSKEFLEHIFEPFSRAESATKSGVTGTGLGMAITKSLAELMGGTITIESEPDVGTTVRMEFENRIAEPVAASADIPDIAELHLEGKKILLVEDNDLNREIATDILEEEGIAVDSAEDGDIAVEKMRTAQPGQYDLILMDIQMPRVNGYDATRAIRALPGDYARTIPIIAMTANAFDEDKKNALAAGMNGHLAKPIDVPKLMSTLAELMN